MARGIIYLITNKENGYKYIGQTILPMNKRWQQHIQEANRMSSTPLHKAFRQHGVHRFNIQEIDECDESLLNEKELQWIQHHNPEYNEVIENIPSPNIVEEVKTPPRQKVKSEYKSWGNLTEKNRGNGKHSGFKIRCKSLKYGTIKDYDSAREAARDITGDPGKNANILLAARTGGTAYGYKWQLMEDKTKKKPIFGVNKKTELIELRYESISAAMKELGEDGKGPGLIKSLKNPGRYSWKGHWWFYSR